MKEDTLKLLERLRGSVDLPEADDILHEIYERKRITRRHPDGSTS
ncbi:hypothetical protein KAV46_02975 [Candidatus Bathyarchaeota archaeon]|nr:hypothetical protein [Candidatus Bathyarchaeota archaeon]